MGARVHMDGIRLKELITSGESVTVEFKESRNALSRNVFQTVCALLNRNGGRLVFSSAPM